MNKELIAQTDNTPIRELGAGGSITPMDGRYLVVIDKGQVSHMQTIRDKTLVDSAGYRKLSANLYLLRRQLSWIDGSESPDVLDIPIT